MNFFRFSLLVDADEVSPFLSLFHKQKGTLKIIAFLMREG